jgi:hypothetical protein
MKVFHHLPGYASLRISWTDLKAFVTTASVCGLPESEQWLLTAKWTTKGIE